MAAAVPQLGAVPMDLDVKCCGAAPQEFNAGLRSLLANKECCDLVFVAGEEDIEAHAVVLAASSASFCTFLRQNPSLGLSMRQEAACDSPKVMEELLAVQARVPVAQPDASPKSGQAEEKQPSEQVDTDTSKENAPSAGETESSSDSQAKRNEKRRLDVKGLSSAEAMHILLDYVYKGFGGADWQYSATSAEVNKDVLRLARHFGFSHLHEHAARWLATGLTTENVLERLVTCEEFGLNLLREKITERLALKPAELMLVCSSPEITKHPRILQVLLVQVASLQDKPSQKEEEQEDGKKKEGKADKEKAEKGEEKNEKEKEKEKKPTKAEKIAKQEKPQAEKPAKRRKAGGA